jgi:hypothetical protein
MKLKNWPGGVLVKPNQVQVFKNGKTYVFLPPPGD